MEETKSHMIRLCILCMSIIPVFFLVRASWEFLNVFKILGG